MTFDEHIDFVTAEYMLCGMCDQFIPAREAKERIARWRSLPADIDTPWTRDRAEIAAALRLQQSWNWYISGFIVQTLLGPCA